MQTADDLAIVLQTADDLASVLQSDQGRALFLVSQVGIVVDKAVLGEVYALMQFIKPCLVPVSPGTKRYCLGSGLHRQLYHAVTGMLK